MEGVHMDLQSYELQNKQSLHFYLASEKTLRLKTRKMRVCLCEMLLPVVLMLAMVGGWSIDTGSKHLAGEYYSSTVNYTDAVRDVMCTTGYTAEQQEASPYLSECMDGDCGMPMWPTADAGDGPRLCLKKSFTDSTNDTQGAMRAYYFDNIRPVTKSATPVPPLDVLFSLQSVVKLVYKDRDTKGMSRDKYDVAFRKNGKVQFVAGEGCTCSEAKGVISYFQNTSKLFASLYEDVVRDEASCPGVWFSEDDAVEYVTDVAGNDTFGIVVLDNIDFATHNFDYTIRLNYSSSPSTSIKKSSRLGLGSHPSKTYVNSGFSTLQHVLGLYFTEGASAEWTDVVTFPMPTKEFTSHIFLEGGRGFIVLVLALAFLYPMSGMVGALVTEKETRLREGMLTMGLSKAAFLQSWYVCYLLMLTLPAVGIAAIGVGTFFGKSSFFLLFVLVELYVATLVAQGMLFSVFFSKSRIAAIAAPLLGFMMLLPRFWLSDDASSGTKIFTSISSTVAFGNGLDLVIDSEISELGSSFADLTRHDGYSFLTCFMLLLGDVALYLFLFWYCDNVLPSQYGVKRHPLFLFSPSYWGCTKRDRRNSVIGKSGTDLPQTLPKCVDTELDEVTRSELNKRERVRIEGLRLDFPSPDKGGERFVAVDSLGAGVPHGAPGGGDALCFYEGQVQCVLGHNGAGKTTLINMLTGMYAPTGGDCTIWGESIRDDMDSIRNNIGVCPQHNILWDRLSCSEHLYFYGRLKGVPSAVLQQRVVDMLKMVNLFEKKDAWSETLSGGQKRKLSVGCALIGGSKLIFLDEPTAGMDVESRRAMWHLLRDPAVLKGRVIVLTTHYMEEADVLGDSVAIMHKGCLHSWGSPFFLKSRLGVGYNMSVSMRRGCDPDAVESFVKEHLPRADVSRVSCTGTELCLRIPTDSLPCGQGLATATNKLNIAAGSTPSQIRKEVTRLQDQHGEGGPGVHSATVVADCDVVLASMRTVSNFPALFDALEQKKAALGVEGCGMGVTTLEEVFIEIEKSSAEEEFENHTQDSLILVAPSKNNKVHSVSSEGENEAPVSPLQNFGGLYSITNKADPPTEGKALHVDQFRAMFMKRFYCARRDKRTLCFQFVFPVFMIILAMFISSAVLDDDKKDLVIDAQMFDDPSVPYAPSDELEQMVTYGVFRGYSMVNSALQGHVNLSHWAKLPDNWAQDDTERPWGVVSNYSSFYVLANESFYHGLPAGMRAVENARLKMHEGLGGNLDVHNHPLPVNKYRKAITDSASAGIFAILVLIPFSFIPSNFVSFVVKEKQCRAKHVQVVSGANLVAYWSSTFLFDLASYMCTVFLAFVVFFIGGKEGLVDDFETFFAALLLFLFYGIAASWSSYLISFMFADHTSAQNAVLGFNFLAGFVTVTVVQNLLFQDSTEDTAHTLQKILRVIPSFALGDGLLQMSMRKLYGTVNAEDIKGPFDLDIAGYDMLYMAVSGPIYMFLTLLCESSALRAKLVALVSGTKEIDKNDVEMQSADMFDAKVYNKLSRDKDCVMHRRGAWLMCRDQLSGQVYYFNERTAESTFSSRGTPFHRDEHVEQHAREVLNSGDGRPGDFVTVQNLRKVFGKRGNVGEKVAVADLSFGVARGELFAFLGTNGAGKTTALSMLSGEFAPTSGRALIAGHDVQLDAEHARQNVGYCPQFDALLDHLTCEEHLDLYARLRGIPMSHRADSTELLLNGLGLVDHRKKMSSKLSGGNKRKLSVAIAMIGGPAAVLLDEPSAGMDPLARRSLWGALEKAITDLKLSVILTTHHLEEVEGLSRLDHRVTIMVDGRLQCLGDLSGLKQQLGDSFELTVKLRSADAETRMRAFVTSHWKTAELVESAQQRLTFQVPKKEATLAALFGAVEASREELTISDYTINEMSLEQVFLRISESAVREEEVVCTLQLTSPPPHTITHTTGNIRRHWRCWWTHAGASTPEVEMQQRESIHSISNASFML